MPTLPTQPFGPRQVAVSRIALGCMGLSGTWNPAYHRRTVQETVRCKPWTVTFG